MNLFTLIFGLIMMGLGLLVKAYPDLISGYNTLTREQKQNVDIEGLSAFMRNGFLLMGILIIAGYSLFNWLGFAVIANSVTPVVTLVGLTLMILKAQKFNHNTDKKTGKTYLILGITGVFVIGLFMYGSMPSKTTFKDASIEFSGIYGFEMNFSEIEKVILVDSLPAIQMRTNGYSFGGVKKGFFRLDQLGKCQLMIQSKNPPYLIILKKNGDPVIINFKDPSETRRIYNKMKAYTDKS
jgi:hypothetical protein